MTFLIADGVTPGNTDREYVLRRIIRRAARHGRYLGIHRPFLALAHAGVVEAMGDAYPEIKTAAAKTAEVITQEESRFGETLDRGLELIDTELARIKKSGGHTLPGEVAFKLYDTYGFPLDLTEDVLRNHSIDVDVAGFDRLMEEQKERGRAARKDDAVAPEISLGAGTASRFVGYHSYEGESEVLAARRQGRRSGRGRRRRDALLSRGRRTGRRSRRDRNRDWRDSRSVGYAQGRRLDRSRRTHSARRGRRLRTRRARQAQGRSPSTRRCDAQSFGDAHPALRTARRARQFGASGGLAGRSRQAALRLRASGSGQGRRARDDRGRNQRAHPRERRGDGRGDGVRRRAQGRCARVFRRQVRRPRARGQDGRFFGRAMRRHAHLAHRRRRDVQARSRIGSRGGRAPNRSGDRTRRARNDPQARENSRRNRRSARCARRRRSRAARKIARTRKRAREKAARDGAEARCQAPAAQPTKKMCTMSAASRSSRANSTASIRARCAKSPIGCARSTAPRWSRSAPISATARSRCWSR